MVYLHELRTMTTEDLEALMVTQKSIFKSFESPYDEDRLEYETRIAHIKRELDKRRDRDRQIERGRITSMPFDRNHWLGYVDAHMKPLIDERSAAEEELQSLNSDDPKAQVLSSRIRSIAKDLDEWQLVRRMILKIETNKIDLTDKQYSTGQQNCCLETFGTNDRGDLAHKGFRLNERGRYDLCNGYLIFSPLAVYRMECVHARKKKLELIREGR